jgi:hypothetical protein
VAKDGKVFDLASTNFSGITREQIEEMLKSAEADQELLETASNWTIETATQSAEFANIATANIKNLFVTESAAINNLSVSSSVSLGTDMIVSSITNEELTINSINTLSAPLQIQSLAMAPIEIMAGRVKIDTNGSISISGNLSVRKMSNPRG